MPGPRAGALPGLLAWQKKRRAMGMEQGPMAGQKKRKVQELRQGSHLAAASMSQVKKKMTKVGDRLLWGVLGEGCWGPRGVGVGEAPLLEVAGVQQQPQQELQGGHHPQGQGKTASVSTHTRKQGLCTGMPDRNSLDTPVAVAMLPPAQQWHTALRLRYCLAGTVAEGVGAEGSAEGLVKGLSEQARRGVLGRLQVGI